MTSTPSFCTLSFCRQYAIPRLIAVVLAGAIGATSAIQMVDAAQATGLQTPRDCAAAVGGQCAVGTAFLLPRANAAASYERCLTQVYRACANSDAARRL
ncbi:hypothetical protein GCM10019059_33630 [Camelimonas fluminis]|uniref:Cysteine rich repeat protein n=1 Tax=Camelimonas fluminis TaxID=1576911 RepID=A0ABV7UG05_9HYPH|nr:hypothetical protein [Camelimonas fluminis]GHE71138.1 hypothetical protein GCM10019059_33630 [Camelimonas fluminis]